MGSNCLGGEAPATGLAGVPAVAAEQVEVARPPEALIDAPGDPLEKKDGEFYGRRWVNDQSPNRPTGVRHAFKLRVIRKRLSAKMQYILFKSAKTIWDDLQVKGSKYGDDELMELRRQLDALTIADAKSAQDFLSQHNLLVARIIQADVIITENEQYRILLCGVLACKPDLGESLNMIAKGDLAQLKSLTLGTQTLCKDLLKTEETVTANAITARKVKGKKEKASAQATSSNLDKGGSGNQPVNKGMQITLKSSANIQETPEIVAFALDSDASRHIAANVEVLIPHSIKSPDTAFVTGIGNAHLSVKYMGNVILQLPNGKSLLLRDVLVVPGVSSNLVSEARLHLAGLAIKKHGESIELYDAEDVLLVTLGVTSSKRLMPTIGTAELRPIVNVGVVHTGETLTLSKSHVRFGHVCKRTCRAAAAMNDPQINIGPWTYANMCYVRAD